MALAHTWTVHQTETLCQIDLLRLNNIHNLWQSRSLALSPVDHTHNAGEKYHHHKHQSASNVVSVYCSIHH